jgi:hypothetical protein
MSRHLLPLSCALTIALVLPGCVELGCTDELVFGVNVVITEEGGATAEPISITFSVDGGAPVTITDTADTTATGDFYCDSRQRCHLGGELAGSYEITIRRGAASAMATTTVSADRCHVIPRTVPVTLPAP